ncbi:ErpL protein [Borreliella carolinensis]|uniref:ErpL protein n=1 Tax=Borreliella carolinensis TaxID=478174 RepID=A0ACD5GKZ7_9SPIR
MNKIMFIICAVFVLIISCKNYTSSEDVRSSEQNLESSEQFVKESEQEIKKQFNEVLDILETKDLNALDTTAVEKAIKELKDKIDNSDSKKTSLKTYSEYEEKIKQIKEKLKDKNELEKKLKDLEDSLKKKKKERKQALEEAKKKFEDFKKQVDTSTGQTHGDQVQRQGGVGVQAFKCAQELGFKNMTSGGSDTSNMANEVITNSLQKIEEEFKAIEEDKKE